MKNLLGKKVWKLDGDIYKGLSLGSKDLYTIKSVKKGRGCNNYVIEKDGVKQEVSEYNCVVAMCDTGNKVADIFRYLTDNDACPSSADMTKKGGIAVSIEWGDWKHEHLWCDELMGYIGYKLDREKVTADDGSDCYSATRFYSKN